MQRLMPGRRLVSVAALAGLAVTCGSPETRVPTGPTALSVTAVEISGPDTLAPGQVAQFTASVRLADGTSKVATGETHVIWRANAPFMSVDANGLATGGPFNGDATLTADVAMPTSVSTRRGTKAIVVVPTGTYRLVGAIRDAEFPTLPVKDAHLAVTPGPAASTTDADGRYRLFGVPPDAQITVSADGYDPVVQAVHLSGHASRDFQLALASPRPNVAGTYTLEVDAGPGCSGLPPGLPPELQHRRYEALVTQTGPALEVKLTEEPRFRIIGNQGNRFTGQVTPAGATFTLDGPDFYYYFSYPSLAELLSDGTRLVVYGRAATTVSAAGLSGELTGAFIRLADSRSILGGCSGGHFALTPR